MFPDIDARFSQLPRYVLFKVFMRIEIDVKRSIQKGRISVIKRSWVDYFDNTTYIIASSLFCGIAIAFSCVIIKSFVTQGNSLSLFLYFISATFTLLGALMLYSLINDNKFVRIGGINDSATSETLSRLLNEKLNVKLDHNGTVFRFYTRPKLFRWGRRVIIIRDHKDLLVNISRFNERNMKSPFHLFFDVLFIRSLVKEAKRIAQSSV
jgi:hypothetical protein